MISGSLLGIILSVPLLEYIIIHEESVEAIRCYGKYNVKMSNIKEAEIRIFPIGKKHQSIFLHFKESIPLLRAGKIVPKKEVLYLEFFYDRKTLRLFKQFIPKDVPWVYNDYNKYPNLAPKKPKK